MLFLLRAFTKLYAMAGHAAGLLACAPDSELLERMTAMRPALERVCPRPGGGRCRRCRNRIMPQRTRALYCGEERAG